MKTDDKLYTAEWTNIELACIVNGGPIWYTIIGIISDPCHYLGGLGAVFEEKSIREKRIVLREATEEDIGKAAINEL